MAFFNKSLQVFGRVQMTEGVNEGDATEFGQHC